MNIESFREYCLTKKGATEETPFGPDTLVFKVLGKMFALTGFSFESINLKCDPEYIESLREQYDAVIPGYHMNKQHWNTIKMDGSIDEQLLHQWIDDSYSLVVATLTKKNKEILNNL